MHSVRGAQMDKETEKQIEMLKFSNSMLCEAIRSMAAQLRGLNSDMVNVKDRVEWCKENILVRG